MLFAALRFSVDTIVIRADDQGALQLLKNPITSMRSKHIMFCIILHESGLSAKRLCLSSCRQT